MYTSCLGKNCLGIVVIVVVFNVVLVANVNTIFALVVMFVMFVDIPIVVMSSCSSSPGL